MDYLNEVAHAAARAQYRCSRAGDAGQQQAVIAGLQCLRGVVKVSAVMLVSELRPYCMVE